MEIAEIWVYGDPDFLAAVLTGVAHVFAQDVFLYSVAIGFIVNILWSIFSWISAPQKNALFSTLLQSIVIYAILFSPHMNVVLRSPVDNSSTQISGSIPWGIAVPASLMSTMGNAWREEFRDAAYAGLPATSNASLLFQTEGITPLKALLALRNHASSYRGVEEELRRSISDYFTYCMAPVLDLNQSSPTNVTRKTAENFASAFTSNNYWSMLAPVDSSSTGSMVLTLSISPYSTVTCSTAHQTIGNLLSSESMTLAADAIYQTHKWGDDETSKNEFLNNVNDTLLAMDPAVVTSNANTIAQNLVAFDIINGMCGDSTYLDETFIAQCRMQSDAVHKRRIEEATKANGFLEMIVPLTTFVEGFIYLITPLMAVMVAFFGAGAMKMIGKYAMGLGWLAIMPLCQVGVDLYLAVYYNKFLASFGVDDEFGSVSFVNTQWLELESFVAFAGTAQAMVPSLAMFILFGGIHAMQGLAGSASSGLKTDTSVLHGNQAIGMKDFQATSANTKVTSAADGSGRHVVTTQSTVGENIPVQSYAIKDNQALSQAKSSTNQEVSSKVDSYTSTASDAAQYARKNGITLTAAQAHTMGLSEEELVQHNKAATANRVSQDTQKAGQQLKNDVTTGTGGNVSVNYDSGKQGLGWVFEKGTGGSVKAQGGMELKDADGSNESTSSEQAKTRGLQEGNTETSGKGVKSTDTGTKTDQRADTEDKQEVFNRMFAETALKQQAVQQAIAKQEALQSAINNAQEANISFSSSQMIDATRLMTDKDAYKMGEIILDNTKELATRMSEKGFTDDEGMVLSGLGVDVDHLRKTGFVKFDDSFMTGEYKDGADDTRAFSVAKYFSTKEFDNGSKNMLKLDGMDERELMAIGSSQDHREEFAAEYLDRLMSISNNGFKDLDNEGGDKDFVASDLLHFTGSVFKDLGENTGGALSTASGDGKHLGMIKWGEAQLELSEVLREVDPDSKLGNVDVSGVKEGSVFSDSDAVQINSNYVAMATATMDDLLQNTTFANLEDKQYFEDFLQSALASDEFKEMLNSGQIKVQRDEDGTITGFDVGDLASEFRTEKGNFDKEAFDEQFEARRAKIVDTLNGGLSGLALMMSGHDTSEFGVDSANVQLHVERLDNQSTWDRAEQLDTLTDTNFEKHKSLRTDVVLAGVNQHALAHFGKGMFLNNIKEYEEKAADFDRHTAKAMATGDFSKLRSYLEEKGFKGEKIESYMTSAKELSDFRRENDDLSTLVIANELKDKGYDKSTSDLTTKVEKVLEERFEDSFGMGKYMKGVKERSGS